VILEPLIKNNSKTVNEAVLSLKDSRSVYLKNIAGSYLSFFSNDLIDQLKGYHLFVFPEKEEALYFYNDLENIIKNERGTTLLFYPASFRRPFQIEQSDPTSVLQRTEVLNALSKQRKKVIVVTYSEAMVEKVINKKDFEKSSLTLSIDEEVGVDILNEWLIEMHFEKVDYVYEPGQFAVRGGIIDIFSFTHEFPYRIELFGDTIESLREFNPVDQLSIVTHNKIKISPDINHQEISKNRVSFLQYLPKQTLVWIKDLEIAQSKIDSGFVKAKEVYEKTEGKEGLLPAEMYIARSDFISHINSYQLVEWSSVTKKEKNNIIDANSSPQPSFNKNFELLVNTLNEWKSKEYKIHICSDQESQINRLRTIFADLE